MIQFLATDLIRYSWNVVTLLKRTILAGTFDFFSQCHLDVLFRKMRCKMPSTQPTIAVTIITYEAYTNAIEQGQVDKMPNYQDNKGSTHLNNGYAELQSFFFYRAYKNNFTFSSICQRYYLSNPTSSCL